MESLQPDQVAGCCNSYLFEAFSSILGEPLIYECVQAIEQPGNCGTISRNGALLRKWGGGRVTSSTIEIGSLGIGLLDAANQQLVWRGTASKTLDIKKDPDKNFHNLEKAMAKLFRNYPPGLRKG